MVVTNHSANNYKVWLEQLAKMRPGFNFEPLHQACLYAEQIYANQLRLSGESYLTHTLAVAQLLAELRLDVQILAAAILHDIPKFINETDINNQFKNFHPEIMRLVMGVERMDAVTRRWSGQHRHHDQEGLRKLLLSLDEDMRILLIKLAERTHDLRRVKQLANSVQQQLANETMDLYAPLANRLGIGRLKWELEDLSFRYLNPEIYQNIATLLDEKRIDRENYVKKIVEILREQCVIAGIDAEVKGRPKHIYSIWRKMRRKNVDFEHIYDVRALRILVKNKQDCYTVLGIVHNLWFPIASEFDDYIAKPKKNLYQSLHTAVIGPEEKTLEVQIRTHDMHRHAELGVAAHWRYKEGGRGGDNDYEHRVQWLRQFLELDEHADSSEFFERFRQSLQQEHIQVFTPKGQVIELPQGATPLDFAYYVHSEVGHYCRGAKVDGKMVPLTYQLHNGEQVEILTAKRGGPSRDWLNPNTGYLITSHARDKVRQWFKHEHHDEDLEKGRSLIERELARLELPKTDLEDLTHRFHYSHATDLMAAVGRGDVNLSQISNALVHILARRRRSANAHQQRNQNNKANEMPSYIRVHGVGNLVTHIAQCCHPLPGDKIIGHITHSQGISIHRADCLNISLLNEESRIKLLDAAWSVG